MSIIFVIHMEYHTKTEKMYLREIEMISLYIHGCMPHNYAEQGIWANDTSLPLNARLSGNSVHNYSIKIHEKRRIKKSGFNPVYRICYYV